MIRKLVVAAVSLMSAVVAVSQTPTPRQQTRYVQLRDNSGPSPSIGSGCGTARAIAGTDTVGRITIGTGPSGTCVMTFAIPFDVAPVCVVNNETSTSNIPQATSTTTTMTITGTLTASDAITYACVGYVPTITATPTRTPTRTPTPTRTATPTPTP